MTTRPRRTTTLAGPNRFAISAATGGLVVLASVGTALLVLTGTSAVTPPVAAPPPLPSSAPLVTAPGVVVVPSLPGGTAAAATSHGRRAHRSPTSGGRGAPTTLLTVFAPSAAAAVSVLAQPLPAALAFADTPAAANPGVAAFVPVGAAAAPTKGQLRAERKAARAVAKPASRGDHVAGLLSSLTPVAATGVQSAALVRTAAILRSEHGSAETTSPPAAADTTASQAERHAKAGEVVAPSAAKHAKRKHAATQPKPKHAKHVKHVKHDRD